VTELSVIIVTHNSAADLPACLRSLFESRGDIEMRVVVSDSGSTDETAAVAARFPVLFLPGENRGFAAANNRALAHGDVADARYVLFLNPDTAILEGGLGDLIERCDRRPATGIFSVRQVDQDGKLIHSLRRLPSPARYWLEVVGLPSLRRLGHWIEDDEHYCREGEFGWAVGAFLLVRGAVLRTAGWFDERFFFTSEEVDLCRRARSAGWGATYIPSLKIMHRVTDRPADPWRAWILVHHKVVYANKWFSRLGVLLTRSALAARHGLESINPRWPPEHRRDARFKLRAALGLPGPSGPTAR
jgi:hypothetical protein